MNSYVVVREYARLTTGSVVPTTLSEASIPSSAFDWLCDLQSGFKKSGASLLHVENRRWLKLDNYVGILQSPCGTVIEVLPKITENISDDTAEGSRKLLIKMLKAALDLPVRTADHANVEKFKTPLLEWVMKQFINELEQLIKRGLRFEYQRVEDEQRYLRGQLNISKQLRQPPGRDHVFNIRHDVFIPDRPENRLLKTALLKVCKLTLVSETWRLSHELVNILREIPESKSINLDFQQWQNNRLTAHYQSVRPWCELVLGQHMPLAMRGGSQGVSMLFPMEKLFEKYVENCLRNTMQKPFSLKPQVKNKYLCSHENDQMFQLKPDLVIFDGEKIHAVLDSKWKLLDNTNAKNKYGLKQSDFYQLFAYGKKYLGGKGEMMLIYPKTSALPEALPVFEYEKGLNLWVVPFDLEKERLLLREGYCSEYFGAIFHK